MRAFNIAVFHGRRLKASFQHCKRVFHVLYQNHQVFLARELHIFNPILVDAESGCLCRGRASSERAAALLGSSEPYQDTAKLIASCMSCLNVTVTERKVCLSNWLSKRGERKGMRHFVGKVKFPFCCFGSFGILRKVLLSQHEKLMECAFSCLCKIGIDL